MLQDTPAAFLLERCFPLLGAAAFVALSLWIGTLFSVSWVTGRARWMADDTDVGRIAVALCRRWATPFLGAFVVLAFLVVLAAPERQVALGQLVASGLALAGMLGVHASIWRHAARVERGSVRAASGDGMRRVALVLSLAMLLALVSFRIAAS
jgi:hypothetical protein